MDSTTLEEITKTIIEILHNSLGASVEVTPVLLRNDKEGVGFYLFHVQENNNYKNYPAPGKDSPPVNYTPMALNLFYQLSANSQEHEKENMYNEQRWMGTAMKALHDNSIIRKTISTIDFPEGKNIDIKITLQTLTPSESVQYWAAAESPVRLSAYYEVSVVFLEPEKPKSYAGRVLSYGNFIFVRNAPQITSSENTIEYLLPDELTPRQVKIQPAQAPPAFIGPAPIASVVSFFGTGFNGGELELLIINPLWPVPAVADASWLLNPISENQLNVTVQPTAILKTPIPTPVDIIPGLYAAQVSIIEKRTLPNGTMKTFNHVSNQFPFSVMPRISLINSLGGGVFTVTCNVFQNAGIVDDDIQVYIGEDKLELSAGAVPGAGQFKITTATTIDLQVPAGLDPGQVALRILIKGIESEPKWISIP